MYQLILEETNITHCCLVIIFNFFHKHYFYESYSTLQVSILDKTSQPYNVVHVTSLCSRLKGNGKVKLNPQLNEFKHHTIKTYGRVEV
jgi:hypothetical protein